MGWPDSQSPEPVGSRVQRAAAEADAQAVARHVRQRLAVVPRMFLPGPAAVLAKPIDVAADGFQGATLWDRLWSRVMRVSAARAAAILTGVVLGFAAALSATAGGIMEPIQELHRPIPLLAHLPLVMIRCSSRQTSW